MIPCVEFAYNRVTNSTTSFSSFKVVYGFNPLSPFDLILLPNDSSILVRIGFLEQLFLGISMKG